MKKTVSVVLSIFLLLSFVLTGCAAENTTSIVLKIGSSEMEVNGTSMPIDEAGTAPVIVNDRTLLPVRAVVEQMGGSVLWDSEKNEVTLNYGEDEIRIIIDSDKAYLNDDEQTLDTKPCIINERTMLPIRFIAEGFKFNVTWNENDKTVTIASASEPDSTTAVQPEEPAQGKSLVVYFSATGNTKALAEKIAAEAGADLVEIVPEEPYTSADINYSNDDCRANKEHNDDSARPAIANKIENIESYDTIFIGYPIWWGTMPKIINTFLESYDFSGKTIMPFCTSGGSGIAASVSDIKAACPGAEVKEGFRGTASTGSDQIEAWIKKSN